MMGVEEGERGGIYEGVGAKRHLQEGPTRRASVRKLPRGNGDKKTWMGV